MKYKFLFLFFISITTGCDKNIDQDKISNFTGFDQTISERNNMEVDIQYISFPPDVSNNVSFQFELRFCKSPDWIIFTETEVINYLLQAGLAMIEVNYYLNNLKNKNTATPVLAREVAELIVSVYPTPPVDDPTCFMGMSYVYEQVDPSPSPTNDFCNKDFDAFRCGQIYYDIPPGSSSITVVHLGNFMYLVKSSGDEPTISIDFQVSDIKSALMTGGYSATAAQLTMNNILFGFYTPEQAFKIIQEDVLPNLDWHTLLGPNSNINDYRLKQFVTSPFLINASENFFINSTYFWSFYEPYPKVICVPLRDPIFE